MTTPRLPLTLRIAALLALLLTQPGCYLGHLANGQLELLRARRPIVDVLADPATSDALRAQLELVERTRAFAARLGLEVAGQYTSYVPWPGDRIVTNVVAARPGELAPATFWFPLVGDVPYRGFFDQQRAEVEAERLRDDGYDVCIGGVRAYSTLGWFDDPVTAPMLGMGDGLLVETLLHELVHATAYVASQPDFNEGIATFVGQEASVRFYAESGASDAANRRRREIDERRRISAETFAFRDTVAALYADSPPGEARDARRVEIEAEARARLAALPLEAYDPARVAAGAQLNDACLGISSTYSEDVPRYAAALTREPGLEAFIEALRRAAETPDPRTTLLGPTPAK